MSVSPTPAEQLAMKTAWAALHAAASPNSEMVETIIYGLGSAGLLMDPETAAENERLTARVAELETSSRRYRIAWRMARTRALATGGAADRSAARAAELQTALQDSLAAIIGGQLERDALQKRVAELEAELQRLTGRYDAGISAVTEPRQTPTGLWRVRYRRDGRRKARTFPTHEQAAQYAANARKGGERS